MIAKKAREIADRATVLIRNKYIKSIISKLEDQIEVAARYGQYKTGIPIKEDCVDEVRQHFVNQHYDAFTEKDRYDNTNLIVSWKEEIAAEPERPVGYR